MNQELNGLPHKVEKKEIQKGWEELKKKMKAAPKKNDAVKPTMKIVYSQSKWRQNLNKWIRKIKNYWNK